jgi:hypothetical protein
MYNLIPSFIQNRYLMKEISLRVNLRPPAPSIIIPIGAQNSLLDIVEYRFGNRRASAVLLLIPKVVADNFGILRSMFGFYHSLKE